MNTEAWCAAIMGSQRFGHDWVTELTELNWRFNLFCTLANLVSSLMKRLRALCFKACFVPQAIPLEPRLWSWGCSVQSVQFSRSVVSDSLRTHELQQARPPCRLPTPGVYSNSCPSSQWFHPAISSSVAPSPPVHNTPSIRVFFRVNSSHEVAKVFKFQVQHQSFQWTPRTDLLQEGLVGSPCSPRDSQESSSTPQFKSITFWHSAFFTVQLSHPYMTTGKTKALTRQTFVGKVMSLLFNMLSRWVITLLPRSKYLLTSWLQSPSAVILEPPQNKVWHCFHCFLIYFPWSDGTRCHNLSFLNVEL